MGNLEGGSRAFRASSLHFFLRFLRCDEAFSNARLMFTLSHHNDLVGGFGR